MSEATNKGETMRKAMLWIGRTAVNAARAELRNGTPESPHVDHVEIEEQGPVDTIRDIVEAVKYRPAELPIKTLLVCDLGALSLGAQNALLKTIEDVPEHLRIGICARTPADVPMPIFKLCNVFVAD